MAAIWVYLETKGQALSKGSLEALGEARRQADATGGSVTALLIGAGVAALAKSAGAQGADRVVLAEDAAYAAFNLEQHLELCSRALAGRYHPLLPMTWGLTTSAVMLLPFALVSGLAVAYPLAGWLLLLYLGLIPTALAFVVFLAGMRDTSATVSSIVTLVEPLTATLLAWLLFGERLSGVGFAGAALLLGAIVVLTWRSA
jgi:DME family drug/metabolite transporter